MEKVKQTRLRFIGELVKELCEGLKLQQLGNSSKDIIRVLIFFMQVSKCACQSQGPSKGSFATSRLRL
jgi:hypothetical protein